MSGSGIETTDRAPAVAGGAWVFALAASAFLVALVIAGVVMPSDSEITAGPPASSDFTRGQAIFNGEGCIECHSRLVRLRDRGMGPVANAGMLMNETGRWGSGRIGPDLQNIAGRYPPSLLETRLTDPRGLQPETLMPSYSHLDENEIAVLIEYMERPLSGTSMFEAIRGRNNIEAAIPDEILIGLQEFMDFESGLFIPPVAGTAGELVIGRGIYNARCAACHGLTGDGNGPASWEDWDPGPSSASRAASTVPPADFRAGKYRDYSHVMLYWRISEGVPGTGMPAWRGSLSQDAHWFVVAYVSALVKSRGTGYIGMPTGTVVPVFGEEVEVEESAEPEPVQESTSTTESAVDSTVDETIEHAEDASEEEGEPESLSGSGGLDNMGGENSDVEESAESPLIEEETP